MGRSSMGINAKPTPKKANIPVSGHVMMRGKGSLYAMNAKMAPAHKYPNCLSVMSPIKRNWNVVTFCGTGCCSIQIYDPATRDCYLVYNSL